MEQNPKHDIAMRKFLLLLFTFLMLLPSISWGQTTVQFTVSSATVSESAGTYNLEISIANEDASTPTQCEVALTSGDASDVGGYATQTVTFPAASSANQAVTLAVTDDSVYEGDETLTFSIQNVSGGNSAVTGTIGSFNLTIEDNELPTASLPYDQNFSDCSSVDWTPVSISSDRDWSCGSDCMSINGDGGDTASDDYLISPIFDFSSFAGVLSFSSYSQYADAIYPPIELLYTTNYTGHPSSTSWSTLSANWAAENSSIWTNSGDIDISSIAGPEVVFAFHYTSTGTGSGTSSLWEIDNVQIKRKTTPIPTLSEWGMIMMFLLLAGSAFRMLKKRQTP